MIRPLVKVLKINLVIIRGDNQAPNVFDEIQNSQHCLRLGYIPGTDDQHDAHYYVSLVAKPEARNIAAPTLNRRPG